MTVKIGTNIHLLSDFKPKWLIHGHYISLDQGCQWTAWSADFGGMGTTQPACNWQCDQTVAQETAIDILTTTVDVIVVS